MRLTALLRPPPSRRDVEQALLAEVGRYGDGERRVPNAWAVQLSPRDARRRAGDLPAWSASLSDLVVEEQRRLGLSVAGLVTVSFAAAPDIEPGRYRLAGAVVAGEGTVVRSAELLPGRPRLTLAAGGTARNGTPRAAGIDREVMLPAGTFVVGRDKETDLRLHDETVSPRHIVLQVSEDRIRLRDLGSLNGTSVDGVPAVEVDLVDGNRIELGASTLVFHRDQTDPAGQKGGDGS